MSTVDGLVQSVRRVLLGAHRPELNLLAAGIDDSTENLTFTYALSGVGHASYLAVDTEILYVWSSGGSMATAMRGALGTTPAAHTTGAVVECNPRFPNALILDEMRAEIESWPRSVYRVSAVDLALDSGETTVDLAGVVDLIDVLQVYRKPASSVDDRWPTQSFSLKREMGTGDFASGAALSIDRVSATTSSTDLRVVCAVKFDTSPFVGTTDLGATVGLTPSLEDALKYGVVWRLLVGREVKRTFTEAQGEPRHSEEVPPGHSTQTAEAFRKTRNARLAEEAARLVGIYGWRMG